MLHAHRLFSPPPENKTQSNPPAKPDLTALDKEPNSDVIKHPLNQTAIYLAAKKRRTEAKNRKRRTEANRKKPANSLLVISYDDNFPAPPGN